MKISAYSYPFVKRYGYEKAFDMIKNAGFDCADVGFFDMSKEDCPFNSKDAERYAADMRRAADDVGLELNQSHAPFSYPVEFWESEDMLPTFKRYIGLAGILGNKTAVIHPLHYFPEYMGHEDEIFEKNMEYYSALLPDAKAAGVKICTENMFKGDSLRGTIVGSTCYTIEEFIRYVDGMDSEWFGACFDVGHSMLHYQLNKPADYIRAFGNKRLAALHVHDNNGIRDQHLMAYEGIIDWDSVTAALGEIDYKGEFTLEATPLIVRMDDETVLIRLKYMADITRRLADKIDLARPLAK